LNDFVIGGVGVSFLVLGLVQFAKKFGVDGNWNVVLAVVLGFVFGGMAYGIDQALIPGDWVPYIKWVVTALAIGLASAGFYDLGKSRFGTQ
jgi:uncharacterized membrane protein YkvI